MWSWLSLEQGFGAVQAGYLCVWFLRELATEDCDIIVWEILMNARCLSTWAFYAVMWKLLTTSVGSGAMILGP